MEADVEEEEASARMPRAAGRVREHDKARPQIGTQHMAYMLMHVYLKQGHVR